jgi:hypothetical protein
MIDWDNNCTVFPHSLALTVFHLWRHKNDNRYPVWQSGLGGMKKLVDNGTGANVGGLTLILCREKHAHRNAAMIWLKISKTAKRKAESNEDREKIVKYDPPPPRILRGSHFRRKSHRRRDYRDEASKRKTPPVHFVRDDAAKDNFFFFKKKRKKGGETISRRKVFTELG